MTSPPKAITVVCSQCQTTFEDWYRASVNASLDPETAADAAYMRAASTATCPACGHVSELAVLVVRTQLGDDGRPVSVWTMG